MTKQVKIAVNRIRKKICVKKLSKAFDGTVVISSLKAVQTSTFENKLLDKCCNQLGRSYNSLLIHNANKKCNAGKNISNIIIV